MTVEQLIYDRFDFVQCPLEVGSGWHELVYKMLVEIDDAYFDYENGALEPDIEILQIKEKFGFLNVMAPNPYPFVGVDAIVESIIDKYVELSKSTCEICGAEGKLIRDGYWVMVRCEDCL